IFIQQFIESVRKIVQRGLKRDDLRQEDNLPWIKGRLRISAQLSKNCIRRDLFQVEYDECSVNRLENRILKTAINKISRQTSNPQLLQQITQL
ncbi:McrC family protein, partial [Escherichia coli]|nr:McrC family protein [Escherichia coli]